MLSDTRDAPDGASLLVPTRQLAYLPLSSLRPSQPGLAFFYGGLVGETSVVSTMMLSFSCMGLVTMLWALFGFSVSFSDNDSTGVYGGLTWAPVSAFCMLCDRFLSAGSASARAFGHWHRGAPAACAVARRVLTPPLDDSPSGSHFRCGAAPRFLSLPRAPSNSALPPSTSLDRK